MELDGIDSRVDVLVDDVSSVQNASGHVLPVSWVTLHHLVGRGETHVCELSDGELSVLAPVRGDEGGVGGDREVDSRVRDQVGVELVEVDGESAVESEKCRDGGDDLANDTV
jgi:hypothetical protein